MPFPARPLASMGEQPAPRKGLYAAETAETALLSESRKGRLGRLRPPAPRPGARQAPPPCRPSRRACVRARMRAQELPTLSRCVAQSHSNSHSRSHSLSPSLPPSPSLYLSPPPPLSRAHTQTHKHSLTLYARTHTHTHRVDAATDRRLLKQATRGTDIVEEGEASGSSADLRCKQR